jgi:hypothetical protein
MKIEINNNKNYVPCPCPCGTLFIAGVICPIPM